MNSTEPHARDRSDDSAASSLVPPVQPPLRTIESSIFLDSEGLRPIWGITLFLILWELLRGFIFPLFEAIFPSPSGGTLIAARLEFVVESASLLCVAIATWLMAKFEGRTISAYGFNPQQALRKLFIGLITGAALLSALVVALHASGLLIFDARLLFGRNILRAGLIWTAGFLLVAFAEEMLLRGYLQFTLTRAIASVTRHILPSANARRAGFWAAAIILSIVFGYSHEGNPGESPLGLINAVLVGLVFCLSLWRTGSLWWAIGFHAAWDWAQSFLYGVADSGLMVQGHLFATHPAGRPILSGGLTGPEGSILLLPVMLVACAAIFLTLPRTSIGELPANAPTPALDLP
jgi:membrane protease YdiL (CAAX protease family)